MSARLPVLEWLHGYRRQWLRADVIAGVTVTAYLVPQVMAYAELAGLPAVAGLWACLGALVAYALIGTSRVLSVGPESTTALMVGAVIGSVPAAREDPSSFAAALALVVAAICVVAYFARVAVVADLLSRPVLVGYMAGIAVLMVVSQLGKLTRLSVDADGLVAEVVSITGPASAPGRTNPQQRQAGRQDQTADQQHRRIGSGGFRQLPSVAGSSIAGSVSGSGLRLRSGFPGLGLRTFLGRGFRKFRLFHRFIIRGIFRRKLVTRLVTGFFTGLFAGLISGFFAGHRLFLHLVSIFAGEDFPKIT